MAICRRVMELYSDYTPVYFSGVDEEYARRICYIKKNIEKYEEAFRLLSNEKSRKVFLELIRVMVANDYYKLPENNMEKKYFENYKPSDCESFLCLGAAKGDTILKFLKQYKSFHKVYAFEASKREFSLLKRNVEHFPREIKRNIILVNEWVGVQNSSNNINQRFRDTDISLISMDIEGAEMDMLKGSAELIKDKRPILSVCAYHKISDLADIPIYINSVVADYSFFLSKYYGQGRGFSEYVYYAVPNERV